MSQWNPEYPSYPQYATVASKQTDGAAIVTFILALSSFIFWIVPAIAALLLAPGAKRRVRTDETNKSGLGLITSAQILSGISLAIGVLVLVSIAFN